MGIRLSEWRDWASDDTSWRPALGRKFLFTRGILCDLRRNDLPVELQGVHPRSQDILIKLTILPVVTYFSRWIVSESLWRRGPGSPYSWWPASYSRSKLWKLRILQGGHTNSLQLLEVRFIAVEIATIAVQICWSEYTYSSESIISRIHKVPPTISNLFHLSPSLLPLPSVSKCHRLQVNKHTNEGLFTLE